jgi:hypothetical protein
MNMVLAILEAETQGGLNLMNEKVKEILDRDCLAQKHSVKDGDFDLCFDVGVLLADLTHNRPLPIPECWCCHKNDALTDEITEACRVLEMQR